jgi:hypothetical protein
LTFLRTRLSTREQHSAATISLQCLNERFERHPQAFPAVPQSEQLQVAPPSPEAPLFPDLGDELEGERCPEGLLVVVIGGEKASTSVKLGGAPLRRRENGDVGVKTRHVGEQDLHSIGQPALPRLNAGHNRPLLRRASISPACRENP